MSKNNTFKELDQRVSKNKDQNHFHKKILIKNKKIL